MMYLARSAWVDTTFRGHADRLAVELGTRQVDGHTT